MDPSETPGMREMSEVSHRAFMRINTELWIHYTTTSLNRTSICELGFDWTFPVWPGFSFESIGCSLLCQETATNGDAVTSTEMAVIIHRQTNRAALHCLSALQPSITPTEDVTVVHQIAAPCSSLSVSVRRENMFLCSSVRYKAMLSYLRCSTVKFWQSGGYDRQKNKRNPSELIQLGDL